MKKVLCFLICGLLGLTNALAESPGTSGCIVLRYPAGARAIGMGGAFTAVATDVNSIYWNPGGLFLIEGREFSTSGIDGVMDDVYYGHISYAQPVDFRYIGSLGISIATLQGGEAEINVDGDMKKVTALQDYVLTISFANDITGFLLPILFNIPGEVYLGFNLKGIHSTLPILVNGTIDYSSTSAFSLDLGGLYRLESLLFGFPATYSLGLCLQNLGTEMKYEESGDPLPFTMIFGGAVNAFLSKDTDLTLSVDLNKPRDQNGRFNLGVEYWFRRLFAIRGGYKLGYDKESYATGFGFSYGNFQIDYAFSPIEDLKSDHSLSFTIRF